MEAALKTLASSRIGLFGVRPGGYYACNFDEMELRRVVGTKVEYVSLPELQARAAEVRPGHYRTALLPERAISDAGGNG